jgi:rhodanese-related sulfurtransferase
VQGIWKSAARQATTLLLMALIPTGGSAFYHLRVKSWRVPSEAENSVPLSDVQHWGERVLWVDARSEAEYAAGHIPGALLLNLDQWNGLLPSLLQVWERDRMVVVYCSSISCQASREVAEKLRDEVGLQSVFVLRGGWEAWRQQHG